MWLLTQELLWLTSIVYVWICCTDACIFSPTYELTFVFPTKSSSSINTGLKHCQSNAQELSISYQVADPSAVDLEYWIHLRRRRCKRILLGVKWTTYEHIIFSSADCELLDLLQLECFHGLLFGLICRPQWFWNMPFTRSYNIILVTLSNLTAVSSLQWIRCILLGNPLKHICCGT